MTVYSDFKVYGAYTRPDGRKHVCLVKHDITGKIIKRKTVSYPKYLVEKYLGRYLLESETVDHIDGNFSNNELSNLRVVERRIHAKSHILRRATVTKICKICGKSFSTNDNSRIICTSKSCAGKCAHLDGYNNGNSFLREKKNYVSSRSLVEEIPSVEVANSVKSLVDNTEQES